MSTNRKQDRLGNPATNTPDRRAETNNDDWPGIYGAEVCQICGEIGEYRGFFGALAIHDLTKEFIALQHHHPPESRERLRASEERFCEICQGSGMRLEGLQLGSCWLCPACAADPRNRDEDAPYPFSALARRRWHERCSAPS